MIYSCRNVGAVDLDCAGVPDRSEVRTLEERNLGVMAPWQSIEAQVFGSSSITDQQNVLFGCSLNFSELRWNAGDGIQLREPDGPLGSCLQLCQSDWLVEMTHSANPEAGYSEENPKFLSHLVVMQLRPSGLIQSKEVPRTRGAASLDGCCATTIRKPGLTQTWERLTGGSSCWQRVDTL